MGISPKLRQVKSVTEINTHGGYYKTFEVQPDPIGWTSYGIPMELLSNDCKRTTTHPAGGYVIPRRTSFYRRLVRCWENERGIESVGVISSRTGRKSILVARHCSQYRTDDTARSGDRDGRGESLPGW